MSISRLSGALLVALGLAASAGGFFLSHRARARAAAATRVSSPGSRVFLVPHARGDIALDGDLDDPGWLNGARTHAFVGPDGETPARPHSEARVVWADGYLYLGLYAADEDLHAKGTEHESLAEGDDVFHVVFTDDKLDRVIDVSPTGVIRDGTRPAGSNDPLSLAWDCDAKVSVEHDGTLNDPRDHDEEWVIEMAIPFEALGLQGEKGESIGLSLRRCDTLRNGVTLCGSWGDATSAGSAKPEKTKITLD